MSRHTLDPRLKEWLDQVIVPALVREFINVIQEEDYLAKDQQRVEDANPQEEIAVEVES